MPKYLDCILIHYHGFLECLPYENRTLDAYIRAAHVPVDQIASNLYCEF